MIELTNCSQSLRTMRELDWQKTLRLSLTARLQEALIDASDEFNIIMQNASMSDRGDEFRTFYDDVSRMHRFHRETVKAPGGQKFLVEVDLLRQEIYFIMLNMEEAEDIEALNKME